MRVLVAIGCFPPDHGGAGLRIANTYQLMTEKHGVDWRIVTQSRDQSRQDASSIRYINMKTLLGRIKLAAEVLFGRYDLVHCIGENPLTHFAASCAFLRRRKYISELSVDPDARPPSFLHKVRTAAFYKADGFIALTPRLASIFKQKSPRTPVFLRPNPVTFEQRKTSYSPIGLPSKRYAYRHLLLGRFLPRKGQLEALQILQFLPDHELVLAGPVMDEKDRAYLQELQDFALRQNLNERVVFIPEFIDDAASLISQVDSIWCFSEREGLPNIVLEGLWLGKPAYINALLGLEHIVTDGVNGYNLDGSAESKAKIIEQYMQQGFDSASIAANAKDAFSLEMHTRKTWEFLNETGNA